MSPVSRIRKRDGRIVPFQQSKITEAIWKAAQSVGGQNKHVAEKIASQVTTVLEVFFKNSRDIPSVEQIQDLVEKILIENGHAKTAKSYILYRDKHHQLRKLKNQLSKLSSHQQGVSITMDFPPNITIQNLEEICLLGYELGSNTIKVKGDKEIRFSREEILKTSSKKPSQLSFLEKTGEPQAKSPSTTSLAKKIEEVVPPPIETAQPREGKGMFAGAKLESKSQWIEIPTISSHPS